MADIIDLSLVAASRRTLEKLLEVRGLNYFLKADARRPFHLEPSRVDLVVRTAAKLGKGAPAPRAFEHARKLVRRELIRRVVGEMLQLGL
ncbi:MAG: hypothetical protein INH41_21870 [Myxococcaceae bacterium]|jgi:hypothetical protein|nr:hypothetical protein [Myxococcaceae bacterium]